MQLVPTTGPVVVAVHELGGRGRDLLLCHATGLHSHVWLPVVDHLRDSFRCVAVDCRGHGDSPTPPDDDFAWTSFAADVLAVVDHLGLDRPLGVGHSCGAATLLLAEQARPGTFEALWGFEPVVFPVDEPRDPDPGNALAVGARRRREVFESRDAALANYAAKPPFSTLAPDAVRAYVDHGFEDLPDGTVRLKCRGEDEARVYEGGASHPAYRHLAEVACPVTVAFGTEEGSFPPEVLGAQVARLPAGRSEPMPALGHFGPLQDPARVAASIRRAFLGGG